MKVKSSIFALIFIFLLTFNVHLFGQYNSVSPETVTVQLKWYHQFQFAGYYAAIEKGFYKDVGLDVKLIEGTSDINVAKIITSGKADFGVLASEAVYERLNGKKLVLLATIFQHSASALLVDASSNIFNPSELIGKKIQLTLNERPEFLAMFAAESVNTNDLQIANKDKNAIDNLVSGKISAVNGYLNNEPFLFSEKGMPVHIIRPMEYGVSFFGDALFTSEEYLKKYPDRVEKFRSATIKGWEYVFTHLDEMLDLVAKKYNNQNKSFKHIKYEASIIKTLVLPELVNIGYINKRVVNKIAKTFIDHNIISENANLSIMDDFIYKDNDKTFSLSFLTNEEKQWLKDHPDITLGFTKNFEPVVIKNRDGTLSGMYIELYNEINKILGTSIKVEIDTWPNVIKKSKKREVDGILACGPDLAKEHGLLSTSSIQQYYPVIFTRNDSSVKISKLDDIINKRIVYQKGVKVNELILDIYKDKCTVIPAKSTLEALKLVLENKADLAMGLSFENYLISKHLLSGIHIDHVDLSRSTPAGTAIRDDWPMFVTILNKTLDRIGQAKIQNLYVKWMQLSVIKNINFTEEEKSWLEKHPAFKISASPLPPYIMIENDVVTGYMTDIVRAISKNVNLTPEFVYSNLHKDAMDAVYNGEVSATMGKIKNLELEKTFLFSNETMPLNMAIFALKERDSLNNIDALAGKRIATYKKYSINVMLKKHFPESCLVYSDNPAGMMQLVATGKADAAIQEHYTGLHILRKNYINVLGVKGFAEFEGYEKMMGHSYVVYKKYPILKSILDKGYAALSHSELNQIYNKWMIADSILIKHEGVELSFEEQLWLKEHPVIRIGADSEWAPVEFVDKDGKFKGLSIDYLKKIEKVLNVKFEFVNQNWQELFKLAKEQKLDMLTSVAKTPEREKYLDFTLPYIDIPTGIFAGEDVSYISDINLLTGKKITVVEEYAIHDYMKTNFPDIELVLVKTPKEGLQAVEKKKAFAYIDNTLILGHIIRNTGYYNIRMVGETPFVNSQCMAVRKDWPIFKSIIQKAINSISEEERQTIYNKWAPLIHERAVDYSIFWKIGIVILFIILLILLWNRSLAREVSLRTEDLKVSEEKYRGIYESLQDGYMKADFNGKILLANQFAADILGYDLDELMEKDIAKELYYNSDDRKKLMNIIDKNEKVENYELKAVHKDGTVRFIELSTHLFYDNNKPAGLESTFRDITKRKEDEKITARLASVIHQSTDDIVITDTNGLIIYANPAFEKNIGYDFSEVVGKSLEFLKSGKHNEDFYNNIWKTIKDGDVWLGDITNKRKNNTLINEHTIMFPIFDQDNEIINYASVSRDMTEYQNLESQLRQAQKMEAIGTLAGGIAHDFNNILAAILGFTEMSLEEIPEESELYSDLNNVFVAGKRAKELVNQILTFSRQAEQELKPFKIQLVINEALKLLRSSLPTTIEIEKDIDSSCAPVLVDPTQIHQIILNLCTNAYHAMKLTGGVINVALKTIEIKEDFKLHNKTQLKPGQYLELKVGDTGCGIAKENLEKIFDPYFTTKEKGEGTGLGLSTVHGIIMNFKGDIIVESEIDKGTTFFIYLPVIENLNESLDGNLVNVIPKGNERILLVDDDENTLRLHEKMIQRLGYNVKSELNSENAIEIFRIAPQNFDLIITDMTMPKMTGIDLAKEIFEIKEDIPIILCSGYSDIVNSEKAKALGIREYIMKPLIKKEMAEAIRRALKEKK